MSNNAKRFMYVNPNFQHGLNTRLCAAKGNRTPSNAISHDASIGSMRLNPCYNNSVSTSDYSIEPKVHINPKMLRSFNIHINKLGADSNVLRSENKFCKINPPKSEIIPSIETQSYSCKMKLRNDVIRKPCHSLVRNEHTPPYRLSPARKKRVTLSRLRSVLTKYKISNAPQSNESKIFKNDTNVKKINTTVNSSIQKLDKNEITHKKKPNRTFNKSSLSSSNKQINSVFIGGEKYVLQNDKLKRVRTNIRKFTEMKLVKQISINGKSFVRKSADIFVLRMNTKKMKKNNIVCPIYKQSGICKRHDDGKCSYLHDKKLVTICKRFLQGCCVSNNCRLSHNIVLEKMPTCKYYLDGCCARDDCPYLHVKVNENADVCIKFLQGFCDDGANCEKIHANVCPQFYKFGMCNVPKCLFPHKTLTGKNNKVQTCIKRKDKSVTENIPKITGDIDNNENVCRYYSEPVNSNSSVIKDESANVDISIASNIEPVACFSKRPALGSLPSFIAL